MLKEAAGASRSMPDPGGSVQLSGPAADMRAFVVDSFYINVLVFVNAHNAQHVAGKRPLHHALIHNVVNAVAGGVIPAVVVTGNDRQHASALFEHFNH